jgi:hypothetical protein
MQREQKHQAVEFLIADYALLASSLLQAMTGPTDCLVRCVFLRLFRVSGGVVARVFAFGRGLWRSALGGGGMVRLGGGPPG